MIYLNHSEFYEENERVVGKFFRSESCHALAFLVKCEIKGNENALVRVYTYHPDQYSGLLKNGDNIQLPVLDVEKLLEIDVWPKYYFPLFHLNHPHNQWYHDFNKDNTGNYIQALADVMQYALDLGIKEANITLR